MKFIGLSVQEVISMLQAEGYSYHMFYEYDEQNEQTDEVASISYVECGEWYEYSDGQVEVEFDEGVCVAHYQDEDWE